MGPQSQDTHIHTHTAVAKRKQRLSSGSQQDPNCNKITSFEMQQVREQKKGRDGSTISTPSPHDLSSGSHSGGGNAGNAGNSGTMLVRAARLTGANSSLNTNGRGSRVSNMESLGSGDLETRIGNVGTVGSGSSRIAVNSGASISALGSQDDQEEDRMLEERVFQTKWENDCLIKAYTAITLQNLSIEGSFPRQRSVLIIPTHTKLIELFCAWVVPTVQPTSWTWCTRRAGWAW